MNYDQSYKPEVEPFFLPSVAGDIFAIYYHPLNLQTPRLSLLVVPPFAEEMNKSRRMLTLLAARVSAMGVGVLIYDLYGTGDSKGDFIDARWDVWLQDTANAAKWLKQKGTQHIVVLGLRFGALLGLDFSRRWQKAINSMILWQPVLSGEVMLTQFLRLYLAASMMDKSQERKTTRELRDYLHKGQALEIAGYELAPELFLNIERLRIESLCEATFPVFWFDLTPHQGQALALARQRVIDNLQSNGVDIRVDNIVGEPFWSTQEITVNPELLRKTADIIIGKLAV